MSFLLLSEVSLNSVDSRSEALHAQRVVGEKKHTLTVQTTRLYSSRRREPLDARNKQQQRRTRLRKDPRPLGRDFTLKHKWHSKVSLKQLLMRPVCLYTGWFWGANEHSSVMMKRQASFSSSSSRLLLVSEAVGSVHHTLPGRTGVVVGDLPDSVSFVLMVISRVTKYS